MLDGTTMRHIQTVIDSHREDIRGILAVQDRGAHLGTMAQVHLVELRHKLDGLRAMQAHTFINEIGKPVRGYAYVIDEADASVLYPLYNRECLEWLTIYVCPKSYVLYQDYLGIVFRFMDDAFAYRLRWC